MRLMNQLNSRRGVLRSNAGRSGKQIRAERFRLCQEIFETDISSIYAGLPLDETRKYYVYAHLNSSRCIAVRKDGVTSFGATIGMKFFPFYVGKGCGDRCWDINRSEVHRKISQYLRGLEKEIEVVKLRADLSESEALQMEAKLIDIFGLIPYGGYLANLDEGYHAEARRLLYDSAFRNLKRINQVL